MFLLIVVNIVTYYSVSNVLLVLRKKINTPVIVFGGTICKVCTRKAIIKAAKRIFSSDKICRSYCDFYFGVTFFGTQCILTVMYPVVISSASQQNQK